MISNIADFIKKANVNIQSEEFYKKLFPNGNQYGPKFQNIKEIWISEDEALGKITCLSNELDHPGNTFYILHCSIHSLNFCPHLMKPTEEHLF